MLKNLSMGKYFPGNSFIHKLDARVKIVFSVIFFAFIFVISNYTCLFLMLSLILLAAGASQIPITKYFKNLKFVMIFSFVASIVNLLFDLETKICGSQFFSIDFKLIENRIFIFIRLTLLTFTSSILMFTTSAQNISCALESILSPFKYLGMNVQEVAMTISISLRFIPIMFEEAEKIMTAQKAKGSNFYSKNIIKKIKAFYGIVMPLFISSIKKGNDLASAMEARCYDTCVPRTKYKIMKLQKHDVVTILALIMFFTGVTLCNNLKIF